MIYGTSYEGTTRECESCGHFTNEHANCENPRCEKPFCVRCGANEHFCSEACLQDACEHVHNTYELIDDVCDEYVTYYEEWTCNDCGAKLREEGDVLVARRAA